MLYDGTVDLRRTALLGAATGFALALVVSYGILVQRIAGATAGTAVAANALTTLAAVLVVLATMRTFFTSFDPAALGDGAGRGRVARVVATQAAGALLGVVAIHAVLVPSPASYPWLREDPRQLVNDLVGVFGVLMFVWGSAQKPIRVVLMILGLGLVLGYELTAARWHLDAPVPSAELPMTIQRFVGTEVTASGIGVLAFRILLA